MDPSLASAIHAELRRFVLAASTRRSLATSCHVGHPSGEQVHLDHMVTEDPSLRADVLERAIDGLLVAEGACAWLTRGGELGLTDADAEWYAAARTAFARHGLPLPGFFVLNRRGWVDLVGGERREWSRIRGRGTSGHRPR